MVVPVLWFIIVDRPFTADEGNGVVVMMMIYGHNGMNNTQWRSTIVVEEEEGLAAAG